MQSFRKILFAADFSDNSKEAFRAACSLAMENQTRIVVLHVAEPSFVPEEPVCYGQQAVQFFPAPPDKAHLDALEQTMREVYTPDRPLDVKYQAREGDAWAEILRAAQENGSDLIVMGTHGRTGLRWLLAGSVAVAVVRGAPCPVLALRSGDQARPAKPIAAILHPTDFSVRSEAALRVARGLARDHGARLVILHVAMLEFLTDGSPARKIDPRVNLEALQAIRKRTDGPDLKYPVESVLRPGFAPEEIVETAEEMGCDLIVMGTHGRTGLSRLLMGSVTENVLPKASCPVLVVKAGQGTPVPSADRPAPEALSVH